MQWSQTLSVNPTKWLNTLTLFERLFDHFSAVSRIFLGRVDSMFSIICLVCLAQFVQARVTIEGKISKICLSRLAENFFLEAFLYTSYTLSLSSFLLSSQLFLCQHYLRCSPHSQGIEILLQSFLVRLKFTSATGMFFVTKQCLMCN